MRDFVAITLFCLIQEVNLTIYIFLILSLYSIYQNISIITLYLQCTATYSVNYQYTRDNAILV